MDFRYIVPLEEAMEYDIATSFSDEKGESFVERHLIDAHTRIASQIDQRYWALSMAELSLQSGENVKILTDVKEMITLSLRISLNRFKLDNIADSSDGEKLFVSGGERVEFEPGYIERMKSRIEAMKSELHNRLRDYQSSGDEGVEAKSFDFISYV